MIEGVRSPSLDYKFITRLQVYHFESRQNLIHSLLRERVG